MQQEIACCKLKEAEMRPQVERCFHAAEHYWSLLAKKMDGYQFSNASEEIKFYKHVKPLFISEIKFYRLLYHLILFEPVEKPDQIKDFQLREMQRFDKFVRDNQEFCDYYKSGCTDRDEEFFRKKPEDDDQRQLPQYDIIASTFIAMEKYADHIKKLIYA